jgi:hypothetical protein
MRDAKPGPQCVTEHAVNKKIGPKKQNNRKISLSAPQIIPNPEINQKQRGL